MSNTKTSTCKRTFTHLTKSFYGEAYLRATPNIADTVHLNYYNNDGSFLGEFGVVWGKLKDDAGVVAKLEAADDGWAALALCTDVLNEMAAMNGKNVTPDEFCKMLTRLGIEDVTETTDPRLQDQSDFHP